jgi:thiol-disulfide isomerase/thioredoxin
METVSEPGTLEPMTRRPIIALSLSAAAVLAACGSSSSTATDAAEPAAGADPAASADAAASKLDFTAPLVGGGELAAASLQGKDTVLWFWAPWCTTCRGEAPDIAAAAAANADSVTFVGVAGRGEVPAMESFVSDTGVGGFQHAIDADGTLWAEFGVVAQPALAFINQDGTTTVVSGAMDKATLDERLAELTAA